MHYPSPPDCPYYLLSRASLGVTGALKKGFAEAGVDNINPAYLGVLIVLWQQDDQKASELGKWAGLEPSTMTGLLDRMERDGLLQRQPDPNDRRASRIQLTGLGLEAEQPALRVVNDVLDNVFSSIDQRDIDTTNKVLRQILQNCGKEIFP